MVSSMYISLFAVLAVFCLFPWSKRSLSGTVVSSSLCRLAFLMLFFASLVDCCIRSSSFSPIPVTISFVFVVHELVCWFVIIFLIACSYLATPWGSGVGAPDGTPW